MIYGHIHKPTVLFATFSDLDALKASSINDRKFAQLLADFCDTDVAYVARRRSHGSTILAYSKLMRNLISPKSYAVIICRGPVVGLLGVLTRRKVVLHLHDAIFHTVEIRQKILPKHFAFRFLDLAFFSVLETLSISKADSFIVSNRQGAKLLSKVSSVAEDRIYVVPDFIENIIFQLRQNPLSNNALIVGYTGNFMPHDNVLEMIDAVKICDSEGLPIKLYLAGTGPLHAEAIVRAGALKDKAIFFRGKLSRSLLVGFLEEIEVLLCPMSKNIVPSTLPLKLLEGAAAGKAVVTTDCGAIRSLFGDSIVYVSEPLVPNIARSLALLHQMPELRLELGAKARKVAQDNFSYHASSEAIELFLRSYLSGYAVKSDHASW